MLIVSQGPRQDSDPVLLASSIALSSKKARREEPGVDLQSDLHVCLHDFLSREFCGRFIAASLC